MTETTLPEGITYSENQTARAPINTSTGKSTSADDLLRMYDEEVQAKNDKVEEEADIKAKVEQTVPKKLAAQEIVKKLEQKPPQAANEQKEEAEEEAAPDSEKPEADAPSKLRAKLGEEDVELPESATFQVEMNGKPFKFTLTEAVEARLKQEEFNRDMERRIGFASHKERAIETRERAIDTKVQDILSKAAQISKAAALGDVPQAIKALAKLGAAGTQLDPVEYEKQLWENMSKSYEIYAKYSPEQRDAYFARRLAEEAQREAATLKQDRDFQEGMIQLDNRVSQICQELNLPKENFARLYNLMLDEMVGPGKEYQSPDQITPEEVAKTHVVVTQKAKVDQALSSIDQNLLQDGDLVRNVFMQAVQNPEWTVEDIQYIVKQVLNTPSASVQNLNQKLRKANSNSLNSQLRGANTAKREDSQDRELEEFFLRGAQKNSWAARRR